MRVGEIYAETGGEKYGSLVANSKAGAERRLFVRGELFEFAYVAHGRAFAQPFGELVERGGVASGERLYRAPIGQVSHPAVEPELAGKALDEEAEADALDAAADDVAANLALHVLIVGNARAVRHPILPVPAERGSSKPVSPLEALAIFLLSIGASVVQATTGLGFGLMVVPPLILVVGVKNAVVVANLLGGLISALVLFTGKGGVEWRTVWILVAGSVLGMPLGLFILVWANPDVLQVVIAVAVIAFTVLLARGLRLHTTGIAGDLTTGVLSGVLRMSTSMSGPPVVIYLQGRGLSSWAFRGTISAFFILSGALSIVAFGASGRLTGEVLREVAVGIPGVAIGFLFGRAVYERVDEGRFRKLVLGVLFVSSALALVAVLV